MSKNSDCKIISVQLPLPLIDKLQQQAEKNYMSFSAYIRKLLIEGSDK